MLDAKPGADHPQIVELLSTAPTLGLASKDARRNRKSIMLSTMDVLEASRTRLGDFCLTLGNGEDRGVVFSGQLGTGAFVDTSHLRPRVLEKIYAVFLNAQGFYSIGFLNIEDASSLPTYTGYKPNSPQPSEPYKTFSNIIKTADDNSKLDVGLALKSGYKSNFFHDEVPINGIWENLDSVPSVDCGRPTIYEITDLEIVTLAMSSSFELQAKSLQKDQERIESAQRFQKALEKALKKPN